MIEVPVNTRQSDGTTLTVTYNLYTRAEAKKLKIAWKSWRDAEAGDWIYIDAYVLKCIKTSQYEGIKTVVTPIGTYPTNLLHPKAHPFGKPHKIRGRSEDDTHPWGATISEWLDIWLDEGGFDITEAWCEMERRRGTKRTVPRYVMGDIKKALNKDAVKVYVEEKLKREFNGQVEKVTSDIRSQVAEAFEKVSVDATWVAQLLRDIGEDSEAKTADKINAIKEINKLLNLYPNRSKVTAQGKLTSGDFTDEELKLLGRKED